MSKKIAKPNDIRWPGEKGLPRLVEDINANFDALFRALEGAGISPSGVISPPGPTGGGGTGTPPGLSDPVTEHHGGTGKTTYSKGDLLVGRADHLLDRFAVGADGKVLKVVSGTPAWGDATHEVLSATHTDTVAASVVRGDLITGQGATPKWKRLAKGSNGQLLTMGADEPGWSAPPSTAHNDLTGIQGGSATERYHLTVAELALVGAKIPHRLDEHTAATAAVDFNGQQATDFVVQNVANEAAVLAYAEPVAAKLLFAVADKAMYVCTEVY